jgi:hypothetical protein
VNHGGIHLPDEILRIARIFEADYAADAAHTMRLPLLGRIRTQIRNVFVRQVYSIGASCRARSRTTMCVLTGAIRG